MAQNTGSHYNNCDLKVSQDELAKGPISSSQSRCGSLVSNQATHGKECISELKYKSSAVELMMQKHSLWYGQKGGTKDGCVGPDAAPSIPLRGFLVQLHVWTVASTLPVKRKRASAQQPLSFSCHNFVSGGLR